MVFFDSQKEHYIQVGVVSGGTCQSFTDPAIFARVEDHDTLEFITKQFWENIPTTSAKAIEKLLKENEERKNENEKLKARITKLESRMSKVSDAKKVICVTHIQWAN